MNEVNVRRIDYEEEENLAEEDIEEVAEGQILT